MRTTVSIIAEIKSIFQLGNASKISDQLSRLLNLQMTQVCVNKMQVHQILDDNQEARVFVFTEMSARYALTDNRSDAQKLQQYGFREVPRKSV